jgi:hypothetical protein
MEGYKKRNLNIFCLSLLHGKHMITDKHVLQYHKDGGIQEEKFKHILFKFTAWKAHDEGGGKQKSA